MTPEPESAPAQSPSVALDLSGRTALVTGAAGGIAETRNRG